MGAIMPNDEELISRIVREVERLARLMEELRELRERVRKAETRR